MSVASVGNVVGSIGGVASAASRLARDILNITGGSDGSWDTSLQQASYGGINFGVISATVKPGRKNVVHEYAFRDEVWVEDIGKKSRRFSVIGFLIEDDIICKGGPVIEQRRRLLDVLEKKADVNSPGLTLVHPTLGKIDNVCCLDCDFVEHVNHGRYFEIRFDFIISGKRTYPDEKSSTSEKVKSAADKTGLAAILDFANSVATAIAKGAAVVMQAVNTVTKWYQTASKLIHDVRRFFSSISTLSGNFGSLFGGGNNGYSGSNRTAAPSATTQSLLAADTAARTRVTKAGAALTTAAASVSNTQAFGAAVIELSRAVAATASDPADAVRILAKLADFTPADVTSASPVGNAMATMQTAVGALSRRAALAELARASSDYQPSSTEDAIAIRNMVTGLLDKEITIAGDQGDDASYAALIALRQAVVADLNARGTQLMSMSEFSFNAPMSSLVVASRVYRDASRADGLVLQVGPIHPAFLPNRFTALSE